jgi:PAS domain S-box-containing protein
MSHTPVLLLDLDEAVRVPLATALSAAGLAVEGSEGVEADPAPSPALVILGPVGAEGLAARVAALRSTSSRPLAVVVLLQPDHKESVVAAARAGVDDFAFLPVRADELVARAKAAALRAGAMTEMERQRRDAAALLELSQTLSSSLQVPLILHAASRLMAKVMDLERCAIVLLDAGRNEGVMVAVSEDRNIRDLRIKLDKYPEIRRVVETGAPVVVQDVSHDPMFAAVREATPGVAGTALLFPMLLDEKVSGAFFLRSRTVRRLPDEREMQFGQTVANATGVAIRNARLLEGQKQSTERISKERERAEERLKDLQKYEAFFEDAADGMVILDGDGCVLYANREGGRLFGLDHTEAQGRKMRELLAVDSAAMLDTVIGEVVRGRFRKNFDLYAVRDDGEERCLACSAGAVAGSGTDGRVCMISLRDVTETREMQTELKTTKEFLENLIDSSVDAIIAGDIKGNIILFNKGAEKVYGYRADEVIGRVHVSKLYPPGVAQEIMVQLRSDNFGGRGKLEAMRKFVRTKTNEDIPVSLTASIIYEGGDEVATVGIFTDLRERIKIEAKLDQAQARLIETEKAAVVAQLAGAAAHELNQPLTSVLGYAEMMRRRILEGDPLRRSVDIIFKEGERMAEIVRKIGRITRYETKNYVGNTMIVDLDKASNPGQVAGASSSGAVTTPPGGAAGTGTQTTPGQPPPKTP